MFKAKTNFISQPEQHSLVCKLFGQSYSSYEDLVITFGNHKDYLIKQKIGRGKYSQVFIGVHRQTGRPCVLKILLPIKEKRIKRQLKILMIMSQAEHSIKLLDILKLPLQQLYCLVFQYIQKCDLKSLGIIHSNDTVRWVIRHTLLGIQQAHSRGIMHRDIKPQNIVVDRQLTRLKILDWGLAEFYLPGKDYNVKVSSRVYKGPQLLVDIQHYHYSLDIWSLGVMFAGIIFQRQPFFKPNDNLDQLNKIIRIFGSEAFNAYLKKYNVIIAPGYQKAVIKSKDIPLQAFINPSNEHLATPKALDLLKRMLVLDHSNRITPSQALKHEYLIQ